VIKYADHLSNINMIKLAIYISIIINRVLLSLLPLGISI